MTRECYNKGMRNLRKIFESLGLTNTNPILAVKDARARMLTGDLTANDKHLLNKIMDAVIDIAEADAKKAEEEAAKASAKEKGGE
jgi:hypothetical protein